MLPDVLPVSEQAALFAACATEYPAGNASNLDALGVNAAGLWTAWEAAAAESETVAESAAARREVERLRWVTLGLHYDWTAKEYPPGRASPFPTDLAALLTRRIALPLSRAIAAAEPAAAARCAAFVAEAAIVNYYRPSDTLMAHTDHSEEDTEAPLLSVRCAGRRVGGRGTGGEGRGADWGADRGGGGGRERGAGERRHAYNNVRVQMCGIGRGKPGPARHLPRGRADARRVAVCDRPAERRRGGDGGRQPAQLSRYDDTGVRKGEERETEGEGCLRDAWQADDAAARAVSTMFDHTGVPLVAASPTSADLGAALAGLQLSAVRTRLLAEFATTTRINVNVRQVFRRQSGHEPSGAG